MRPPKTRKASALELQFLHMWRVLDGPAPNCEYQFCERKWRFDFAWPDAKVAVEIEGGIYKVQYKGHYSRHSSPAGMIADMSKYNRAAALGWRVFRFTAEMLQPDELKTVREVIVEAVD